MPFKLKSGGWMAAVMVQGRRMRHRCKTRKEALDWEMQTRKTCAARPSPQVPSLGEWSEAYLTFSQGKHVSKTYNEKKAAFALFFKDFAAGSPVDSLTRHALLKSFQHQAAVRSGHAANKDRKNLLAAWSWGVRFLDLPAENPFAQVPRYAEEREPRRVPTLAEFWAVHKEAASDQDKRMLLLFLYSAARRSELFLLRWQDVDFSGHRIRLFSRKNRQGSNVFAWVDLTEGAMQALREQAQEFPGTLDDCVFRDPATGGAYLYRLQWLRRLCDRAGVQRFGVHGLRHLCATILAARGVPLVDIQRHLRHENLTTTQRYIHQLTSNKNAVRALSHLDE